MFLITENHQPHKAYHIYVESIPKRNPIHAIKATDKNIKTSIMRLGIHLDFFLQGLIFPRWHKRQPRFSWHLCHRGKINPCDADFVIGIIKDIFAYIYIYIYIYISTLGWRRLLDSSLIEENNPFVLQSQNHCYWWPCDARNQVRNSHGINIIVPEYSSFDSSIMKKNSWYFADIFECVFLKRNFYFLFKFHWSFFLVFLNWK